MTSAASASCGTAFGLTKLVTSMTGRPAAVSASTNAIFALVGIVVASFWRPSRGPTSTTTTSRCGVSHESLIVAPSFNSPPPCVYGMTFLSLLAAELLECAVILPSVVAAAAPTSERGSPAPGSSWALPLACSSVEVCSSAAACLSVPACSSVAPAYWLAGLVCWWAGQAYSSAAPVLPSVGLGYSSAAPVSLSGVPVYLWAGQESPSAVRVSKWVAP